MVKNIRKTDRVQTCTTRRITRSDNREQSKRQKVNAGSQGAGATRVRRKEHKEDYNREKDRDTNATTEEGID